MCCYRGVAFLLGAPFLIPLLLLVAFQWPCGHDVMACQDWCWNLLLSIHPAGCGILWLVLYGRNLHPLGAAEPVGP